MKTLATIVGFLLILGVAALAREADRLPPPLGVWGKNVPEADPERDQAEIDFEPRTIASTTSDPMTLEDALGLVSRETGSRIIYQGPDEKKQLATTKQVDLQGKSFWQAYDAIRDAWDLHVTGMGSRDGTMTANHGAPEANQWNPFGFGSLATPYGSHYLAPAETVGPYKIIYERSGDQIFANIYPEPRLRYCQSDRAQMIVWGDNGKKYTLPLKERSKDAWVSFGFDASRVSGDIARVGFQGSLAYAHDRTMVQAGKLGSLVKRKRPVKAELFQFAVLAVAEGTNDLGEKGLDIEFKVRSGPTLSGRDLYLVLPELKKSVSGPTACAEEGTLSCFYPIDESIPLADLEFWVRAPRKISRDTLEHTIDLR